VIALGLLGPSSLALPAGGETHELLPETSQPEARFGSAVALEGTVAAVGAPWEVESGVPLGAAYLFDVATGQQSARLLPDGGSSEPAFFGVSVGLSGTTLVVGAESAQQGAGAAYLFDVLTGLELRELTAGDPAPGKQFGHAVDIDGTTVVVGAVGDDANGIDSGSAYLFDALTGQQLARLLPDDGDPGDRFGFSVAIHGARALIGAPGDSTPEFRAGSVYVFDAQSGAQLSKLTASDGAIWHEFGTSVAIDGDRGLIGAPYAGGGSGAAYLFDLTTGSQLSVLRANDGAVEDLFGASVAMHGTTALVGAPWDDGPGPTAGSAYLFDLTTGQQIARLRPAAVQAGDLFGGAVALQGTTALVGALRSDEGAPDGGAAYLFDTSSALARPYCFGDGQATPCPCGNEGEPGRGCGNSAFSGGAGLAGAGSPCVGDDDFVLTVRDSRPDHPGLFFQAADAAAGGAGAPFGDGLRCAVGDVLRLEAVTADSDGAASSSRSISAAAGLVAGDVRRYQWWYRDPGVSPCQSEFNLSNGLEVIWGP
jgi:hypothetical protein